MNACRVGWEAAYNSRSPSSRPASDPTEEMRMRECLASQGDAGQTAEQGKNGAQPPDEKEDGMRRGILSVPGGKKETNNGSLGPTKVLGRNVKRGKSSTAVQH